MSAWLGRSFGQWYAKVGMEGVARVVNYLLLLALAGSLEQLTWSLWPRADRDGAAPLPAAASLPIGTDKDRAADLRRVAALHLFGERKAVEAPKAEVPKSAPQTRLNLKLYGVIAAEDSRQALAIIGQANRPGEVYRIGDGLPGGAKLHSVHGDRVILLRGGRYETLYLPKERSGGGVDAQPAAVSGRQPSQPNRPGRAASGASSLREYRDRLKANPQELMGLARLQPVMEGGRLKGYRVSPNKERALFRELGLRSGDVVTAVNGIPVNDPAQAGELFKVFGSADRFEVAVERKGRMTTLSVELK